MQIMDNSFLFSFVLPAYKSNYLAEAIQSILQQTYAHFELIIVNDASPEDLDSIVNSFNDSRIRYYRNEKNIGGRDLIGNWNHCITYTRGEFLIMASDDDIYEKDFLKEIEKLIAQYPYIDVYKARAKKIDHSGSTLEIDPQFSAYSSLIEFMYNRRKGMISCVPNYVFCTSILKASGGFVNFPAAWHSDAATVDLMALKGIAVTTDVLFSFRSSTVNISNRKDLNLAYDKLSATVLYDRWFDENIDFHPKNEGEEFLVQKIIKQRIADREYMCQFIMRPYPIIQAFFILKKINDLALLSKKQLIKLAMNYLLRK